MNRKSIITILIAFALVTNLIAIKPVYAEDQKLTFANVTAKNFAGGPNFGTTLANAYDGNNQTFANYAANKKTDKYREGTYFLFELAEVCDISKIDVIFANPTRVHKFELYVSEDNISYTKVYEFLDTEYGANGSEFAINVNVKAKYFKLMAIGAYVDNSGVRTLNENYHLAEFAVYGKASAASNNKINPTEVTANGFASGPNFGQLLEHLTDGNITTSANYAAKLSEGAYIDGQYFLIDLGDEYDLEKLALVAPHSTTKVCWFDLYISSDNINFTKVYSFAENQYGHDGVFDVAVDNHARYIKIMANGAFGNGTLSNNFQLYEFAAYGTKYEAPYVPVAGKINIQSGTMNGFSNSSPVENTTIERAFDGDDTNCVKVIGHQGGSGNNLGDNAYFTFDLGSVFELDSIKLNFGATRAHFYKVLVSEDGNNFVEVSSYTSGDYGKTDGYYVKIDKLNNVKAKFVRIVAFGTVASPGNQYYMINEVSLFGTEVEMPNPQTNDGFIVLPLSVFAVMILGVFLKKRSVIA